MKETQKQTSPKKFVFKIQPENVNFVDALSYQDKNELINRLIYDYRAVADSEKNLREGIGLAKKIITAVISIIVGLPLIFYLIGFSLDKTKSSYNEMQKNFEQLMK